VTEDFAIDGVVSWLKAQGRDHFGAKSARQYWTAIERFSVHLDPGEPREASWFLEHLEPELRRRFEAESPEIGESSVRTYVSRARGAIQMFAEWRADPVNWSPRRRRQPKEPTPGSTSAADASAGELTLEQEIMQAVNAMSRWPKLRPYLMVALSEAMKKASREPSR
jgi:hypothetical protein